MHAARQVRGFKRKLPDGKFSKTLYVDFVYRGVRTNRDTGCTTVKELNSWVAIRKREIDQELAGASRPLTVEHQNMTVALALNRYWEQKLKFSRSADRTEAYLLNRLIANLGEKTKFVDVRTNVIMDRVVIPLKNRRLKAASINRELKILQAAHRWAQEVWELEDLPTIAWRRLMQKGPVRVIKSPTIEQIRLLWQHATPRLRAVIAMAALTGLRHFEIRGLKRENVNLAAGTMTLIGKGNKEAVLPLSSAAISLLSSIQRENSSQLFDLTNFSKEWRVARTKAGIPGTRFHDLRHAFATLLDQTGVPVQRIKTALRHSDISTSLKYVDAENHQLQQSLEAVAGLLKFDDLKS